ncbi:ABC transporter permease [Clostridium ganghwense]|uniref:ABC transporter permease n=1 Tax=Clostridium ganghwense TaxID=312089 RepID=A0ABT4CPX2_9CLOT|nr:ABC transporter permease [Clostridium ganghwense]MCY6371109.1 ABC transporter permease [Clostridium ganghwense]
MTLFNIAIKNVKRNFYNYFIYFVSMVFSIMIYYTFTSIQYNDQVIKLVSTSRKIGGGLEEASIVIAIFSAIFIWYSNSFFTRKRKKEIGLYSLMGVRKKQIGRMLFYENIVMGILALGAGIFLGSLLSKVFVMLLVTLMGFSANIKFTIIPEAIVNTLITFAILFSITSIHGYTIIYRFKLIDLFKAESKGEKEPKTSIITAILSLILIVGGYTLYLNGLGENFHINVLITLIVVVLGTYLFFSSFVVFIIKFSKNNKRRYYKGINMIGISHLLYRIKGNARTLATIAVLSATTLTAMGVTSSFYYDFQTKLDARYPFTYINALNDRSLDEKIEDIMNKYPKNKILDSVDIEFLKLEGKLPSVFKEKNSKSFKPDTIYIISESKFNEIAKARGLTEKINLTNSNETVLFDQFYRERFMESYTGKNVEINLNDAKKQFKIIDFKSYSLVNEYIATETLVVKDEIYSKYYNHKNIFRIKAYMNDNKKDSDELTKELKKVISEYKKDSKEKTLFFQFSSYYESYKGGLMQSGLLIFTSGFLGLVFLVATGSIIFFKQLSEANNDKERYTIIKKIGVNKKEIRASIAKQILFVFLLPLIVGIVHSLVAVSILGDALKLNLTIPIGISVGAYTLIYMVYYVLTVNSYTKTVNSY